jgi:hypothetical protein
MSDSFRLTLKDIVNDIISNGGALWRKTLDDSFENPNQELDISEVSVLIDRHVNVILSMFKVAMQESYNLGLQDAQQLVDWDLVWDELSKWDKGTYLMQTSLSVEFKSKIKELVVEQMVEKSK